MRELKPKITKDHFTGKLHRKTLLGHVQVCCPTKKTELILGTCFLLILDYLTCFLMFVFSLDIYPVDFFLPLANWKNEVGFKFHFALQSKVLMLLNGNNNLRKALFRLIKQYLFKQQAIFNGKIIVDYLKYQVLLVR